MKRRLHMPASHWLLVSFLRAIPMAGGVIAAGVAAGATAAMQDDPAQRRVLALTAGLLLIAVPGLFAGPHVRHLVSQRRAMLLPGFSRQLLTATGLLMLGLATLWAGLAQTLSGATSLPSGLQVLAALSALFWFGFLPALPRFVCASAAVAAAVAAGSSPEKLKLWQSWLTSPRLATITALGWWVFALWLHWRLAHRRRLLPPPNARLQLPMGLRLPGPERIGSSEGTWLLGMGDAFVVRLFRAAFGLWLLPSLLISVLIMFGGLSAAVAGSPVLLFLALAYSFAFFLHLADGIGRRRRRLWLRTPGSWRDLQWQCERVLLREWLLWAALLGAAACLIRIWLPAQPVGPPLSFLLMWLGALWLQGALRLIPDIPRTAVMSLTLLHLLGVLAALASEHVNGGHAVSLLAVLQPPLALAATAFARWQLRHHY